MEVRKLVYDQFLAGVRAFATNTDFKTDTDTSTTKTKQKR